jgi:hypothetical protein
MRNILIATFSFIVILGSSCSSNKTESTQAKYGAVDYFPTPERPAGQEDVIELRTPALDTVRIGFIGLGMRGSGAIHRYTNIGGVKIVAMVDIIPEYLENAQRTLDNAGIARADGYTGKEDWKKVCERDDIDLIYITTNWELHTPIAKYAMEHGKHVALEVPASLTIDECWQLVNTSEQTRKHCMMLENCNYDFFEMTTLNMAQKGLLG